MTSEKKCGMHNANTIQRNVNSGKILAVGHRLSLESLSRKVLFLK